ncbi:hypothetical protein TWF679_010888 [Orbilia oligospora]|uniref:Uncharacterized protein n=1 Tax=Orbilia oligospora TaxID=2813651 RepID=A0A8H8VID1_ORBOL|nr:hypothetical protein TWF679_010888 [Orbilia oligospora]
MRVLLSRILMTRRVVQDQPGSFSNYTSKGGSSESRVSNSLVNFITGEPNPPVPQLQLNDIKATAVAVA